MGWNEAIGQRFEMRLGRTIFDCLITEASFNYATENYGTEIAYTHHSMDLHVEMWPLREAPEEITDGSGERGVPILSNRKPPALLGQGDDNPAPRYRP